MQARKRAGDNIEVTIRAATLTRFDEAVKEFVDWSNLHYENSQRAKSHLKYQDQH